MLIKDSCFGLNWTCARTDKKTEIALYRIPRSSQYVSPDGTQFDRCGGKNLDAIRCYQNILLMMIDSMVCSDPGLYGQDHPRLNDRVVVGGNTRRLSHIQSYAMAHTVCQTRDTLCPLQARILKQAVG